MIHLKIGPFCRCEEILSDDICTATSVASDVDVAAADSQRIAVIVPLYIKDARDVKLAQKLLFQLSAQERPADHILLVDDASPIPVLDIVKDSVGPINRAIKLLRMQDNSGPAAARNVGILQAQAMKCNVLCFLDADCAPDAAWVKVMANAHAHQHLQGGTMAYSGETRAAQPCGWVGHYHDFYGTLNGPRMVHSPGQHSPQGDVIYGPTCNFSMKMTPGMDPILFDTDFSAAAFEDVEWCFRVREAGITIQYLRDALVHHAYEESAQGLAHQFWKYGRWEGLVEEKHPGYLALLTACWAMHCSSPSPK